MKIVLIGIMGSGKTSVGKRLSKILDYKFFDMDKLIEKKEKKSVREIFSENGEAFFRSLESEMAIKLSAVKNSVISTGGGVVLNDVNMKYLKKDGLVIFLHRDVSDIIKNVNTKNRPLLRENPDQLYKIAKEREDLYKKYTDIAVSNTGFSKKTAEKIKRILISGGYLNENNVD